MGIIAMLSSGWDSFGRRHVYKQEPLGIKSSPNHGLSLARSSPIRRIHFPLCLLEWWWTQLCLSHYTCFLQSPCMRAKSLQSRPCMLSHFSHVQLCDPMNHSPSGSSVRGILQARILEWVAMPPSRGSQLSFKIAMKCIPLTGISSGTLSRL